MDYETIYVKLDGGHLVSPVEFVFALPGTVLWYPLMVRYMRRTKYTCVDFSEESLSMHACYLTALFRRVKRLRYRQGYTIPKHLHDCREAYWQLEMEVRTRISGGPVVWVDGVRHLIPPGTFGVVKSMGRLAFIAEHGYSPRTRDKIREDETMRRMGKRVLRPRMTEAEYASRGR